LVSRTIRRYLSLKSQDLASTTRLPGMTATMTRIPIGLVVFKVSMPPLPGELITDIRWQDYPILLRVD
jgi:hypothetical protein